MTIVCEVCGAERTYRFDYRPHRFCCRACYGLAQRGPTYRGERRKRAPAFVMVGDVPVVNMLPWQELVQAARPSAAHYRNEETR